MDDTKLKMWTFNGTISKHIFITDGDKLGYLACGTVISRRMGGFGLDISPELITTRINCKKCLKWWNKREIKKMSNHAFFSKPADNHAYVREISHNICMDAKQGLILSGIIKAKNKGNLEGWALDDRKILSLKEKRESAYIFELTFNTDNDTEISQIEFSIESTIQFLLKSINEYRDVIEYYERSSK
jgi:hypothetical protein